MAQLDQDRPGVAERQMHPHRLRLTAYPPQEPYERWELTVEETGKVVGQGAMPLDQNALRQAVDAHWALVRKEFPDVSA